MMSFCNLATRKDNMRNLEETFRYDDQNRLTEIRLGAVYSGTSTVVEKRGGEETLHYILKDNLGSWTTITDSDGNVEQRLSYDPWGSLRNPGTWSGSFTGKPMLDRGFTGHEHLTAFGLINMKFTLSERSAKLCLSTAERCELGGANRRMYDPVMSSFLSVDRYVQHPESAQGFNRYAYCGHNPLRYVDPSGWEMVKPAPGRTPSSADYAMDPYAYAERAYEPRDLGLLQLPTDDPTVVWMEGNEMHGIAGGNVVADGGWYKSGNEICWSSTISSQNDLDQLGINGTFLGQTFIDENSHIYYSLLGYKIDMNSCSGLAGEVFPLIDMALYKYENDKTLNNVDIFNVSIVEYSTTNFGVISFVPGSNNLYSIASNDFIVYLQIFDSSSGKRENSMNAAFCGLTSSNVYNLNNHYGLSKHTSLVPGYNLYFNNPYANPRCWRVMIVFPTIPVRNNFINRYNNVFGYGSN